MYRDLLDRHAVLRFLLYLITIVAVLYTGGLIWSIIAHFGGIILLFFLAWVVFFILQPLSALLERRGVPRLIAVALIYSSLLAVVLGGIVLAVPMINSQLQQFANQLSATVTPANLAHISDRATTWLQRLGLSKTDASKLVGQFSDRVPGLATDLGNQAVTMATQLLSVAAALIFDAILVAILSFYMMLDGDQLVEGWIQKLPPSWLPDVRLFQRHVEVIFGGFLRAQLIIAMVYGFLTGVVLAALGLGGDALIFAVLAAVLMLIPFIGPFLAIAPPLALVLLQSPSGDLIRNLIIVVAALVVAQQITMQVVAPKVMSAQVGLHPLLLFAALLVGAEEGGVWGAVFAGPVAAIIVAMLDVFFVRFQQASPLYPDITSEPVSEEEFEEQFEEQLEASDSHEATAKEDAAADSLSPANRQEALPGSGNKEQAVTKEAGSPGNGEAQATERAGQRAVPTGHGKAPAHDAARQTATPAGNRETAQRDRTGNSQGAQNGHSRTNGKVNPWHLLDRLLRR